MQAYFGTSGDSGLQLQSLGLSACPHLTSATLEILGDRCPNLRTCTFRNVDLMLGYQPSDQTHTQAPFTTFLAKTKLQSLSLSFATGASSSSSHWANARSRFNDAVPPSDFLCPNNVPSSLRRLDLAGCPTLLPAHLARLHCLTHLNVSGCAGLNGDLPFDCMPDLRHFQHLGESLKVASVCRLFASCPFLSKVILDCGFSWTPSPQPSQIVTAANAVPTALQPFAGTPICSAALPSWALAYLLASSPDTLKSFTLSGVAYSDSLVPRKRPSSQRNWLLSWLNATEQPPKRHADDIGWLAWLGDVVGLPRAITGLRRRSSIDETALESLSGNGVKGDEQVQAKTMPGAYPGFYGIATCRLIYAKLSPARRTSAPDMGNPATQTNETRRASDTAVTSSSGVTSGDLLDLLSRPGPDLSNPQPSHPRSRLSDSQRDWLHSATGGRLLRLDV